MVTSIQQRDSAQMQSRDLLVRPLRFSLFSGSDASTVLGWRTVAALAPLSTCVRLGLAPCAETHTPLMALASPTGEDSSVAGDALGASTCASEPESCVFYDGIEALVS